MPETPTFGRYRVDRRIGAGAFATVWLAHDDILQSPVAVKVLADNWTDRLDIRTRFLDEARILRRADSDHVVRVHDIGELDDGRPYFVMSYADGGTLADRLTTAGLSEATVLELATEVATGLAVLHRLDVVHRDVKPSNVLFHSGRDRERLLIADLGLARAVAHASGFTMTAGTAGYMAPEQSGMAGGVDARADVYAMGALIMHMITGRQPRSVTNAETARLALGDARVVPGELGEIVRKAISINPDDRYDSAVQMEAALRAATTTSPAAPTTWIPHQPLAEPGPPTQVEPIQLASTELVESAPSRRRHRFAIIAAVIVLVLCGAGGAAYAVMRSNSNDPVTVHDRTGRLAVTVPHNWAGQLQDGGWATSVLGGKGHGPGLAVSSDLSGWRSAGSSTAGVFLGASDALGKTSLEKLAKSIAHPGCHADGVQHISAHGLSGQRQHWSKCPSGATFDEILMVPPNGKYLVYLQIKQPKRVDHTGNIVNSIQVSS